MNLALTLAKENDVKMDYSKHADDFYQAVDKLGHGKKDFGITYQYIKNGHKL